MYAHAKADVPILGAVEVDLVGVGEQLLVTIRHGKVAGDPAAFGQRVPVYRHLLGVHPGDEWRRGIQSEQLLHRRGNERRVGDDFPASLRVLGKALHTESQRIHHRVQTGKYEKEAQADGLLIGKGIGWFDVEHLTEHVVSGDTAALLDEVGEVHEEFERLLHAL